MPSASVIQNSLSRDSPTSLMCLKVVITILKELLARGDFLSAWYSTSMLLLSVEKTSALEPTSENLNFHRIRYRLLSEELLHKLSTMHMGI